MLMMLKGWDRKLRVCSVGRGDRGIKGEVVRSKWWLEGGVGMIGGVAWWVCGGGGKGFEGRGERITLVLQGR